MNPTLQDKLIVETPENIFLEFELAGLGSRFIAYLIDLFAMTVCVIALTGIVSVFFTVFGTLIHDLQIGDAWQKALIAVLLFLIFDGYFIFFETIWKGQSVGKKVLNLRVVKDGGYPITFLDSVIRNILRVVDAMPPLYFFPGYGLGSAVLISNRQSKRIGDFVAGTIVIKERNTSGFENFTALKANPEYIKNIRIPHAHKVQGLDYFLLREFFYRKNIFPAEQRLRIARALAAHIKKEIKFSDGYEDKDVRFLDDLMLLLESKKN
ncbi:RDD family protein [bacterium]|nr:RDD family protein [bacterium]